MFAELLNMAIVAPQLHNLNSWLVGVPRIRLGHPLKVPSGVWVLCGYGRMGQELHHRLVRHGIEVVIIDPNAEECAAPGRIIRGFADYDTLREAGVELAAGIVAGTDKAPMVERLIDADASIPAGLISQERAVLVTDAI